MKRPSDADKRVLTESENRKLHGLYTSLTHQSAFGSISKLRKASGLPRKKVLAYIETSKSYTKFKPAQRKFPRLPVISLGINHIWSLDVAFMEKNRKIQRRWQVPVSYSRQSLAKNPSSAVGIKNRPCCKIGFPTNG